MSIFIYNILKLNIMILIKKFYQFKFIDINVLN